MRKLALAPVGRIASPTRANLWEELLLPQGTNCKCAKNCFLRRWEKLLLPPGSSHFGSKTFLNLWLERAKRPLWRQGEEITLALGEICKPHPSPTLGPKLACAPSNVPPAVLRSRGKVLGQRGQPGSRPLCSRQRIVKALRRLVAPNLKSTDPLVAALLGLSVASRYCTAPA